LDALWSTVGLLLDSAWSTFDPPRFWVRVATLVRNSWHLFRLFLLGYADRNAGDRRTNVAEFRFVGGWLNESDDSMLSKRREQDRQAVSADSNRVCGETNLDLVVGAFGPY
jgi:hypothetical protein